MTSHHPPSIGAYSVAVAGRADLVRAQRLRHDTLSAEYGTQLPTLAGGLDTDEFDAYADHLVVRHDDSGEVVGTYRMMGPECAARVGGRFGDRVFDLSPLHGIAGDMVEAGRACVHPAHRNGAVVALLWSGIARYLRDTGHRWLAGSPWIAADRHAAAATWAAVRDEHLAPEAYRVTPRHRLLGDERAEPGPVPAQLGGGLRLGGWICGEPAYDPKARVGVFYLLLDRENMTPRYRRHYF